MNHSKTQHCSRFIN